PSSRSAPCLRARGPRGRERSWGFLLAQVGQGSGGPGERLDRAADDGPGLGAVVDHLELDGLILGDGVGPDVVLDEGVALAGNVLGDRARGWLAALGHLDDPGLKLGPGGE